MCEIIEKLKDETRVETRVETLNALTIKLLNENRPDDLRRAATVFSCQEQLLNEMFPEKP
ncbi:hypothetical protein SAMN06296386_106131 [Lachnospiraceae bacterium]|nr:hypothetical protein SAMN06296386_106131 [Lachnospiraceae bacterium]